MTELPYSTIRVGGADAFEFLQAQLAADLDMLPEQGLSVSAHFLRPVALPSVGRLRIGALEDDQSPGFVWQDGERVCLWGRVEAGTLARLAP